MSPKISIVMTCFNHANYIEEAITSILSQTYTDWELIIVNDGSTDNSVDIIEKYLKKDHRIKLILHSQKTNRGIAESTLLGIKKSRGKYVAFLEDDDIWLPTNLQEKIGLFENPLYKKTILIFNAVTMIGSPKIAETKQQYYSDWRKIFLGQNKKLNSVVWFTRKNPIATFSCVMCKRQHFNNIARPTIKAFEVWTDLWFWAQLSLKGEFVYLDKELTKWRLHDTSYNSIHKDSVHSPEFYKHFLLHCLPMLLRKSIFKPQQFAIVLAAYIYVVCNPALTIHLLQ